MSFDYDSWKAVVLGSVAKVISLDDLLEVSGLIDADYVEEDMECLMRDIEADFDHAARKSNKLG